MKSVSMSFRFRFRADIWHAEATADRNTDRWKLRKARVATVERKEDEGKQQDYMHRVVSEKPSQTKNAEEGKHSEHGSFA